MNIAQTLFQYRSTVEDTVEATLRIYAVFNVLPSQVKDQDSWQKIKINELLSSTYESNFSMEDEKTNNQYGYNINKVFGFHGKHLANFFKKRFNTKKLFNEIQH